MAVATKLNKMSGPNKTQKCAERNDSTSAGTGRCSTVEPKQEADDGSVMPLIVKHPRAISPYGKALMSVNKRSLYVLFHSCIMTTMLFLCSSFGCHECVSDLRGISISIVVIAVSAAAACVCSLLANMFTHPALSPHLPAKTGELCRAMERTASLCCLLYSYILLTLYTDREYMKRLEYCEDAMVSTCHLLQFTLTWMLVAVLIWNIAVWDLIKLVKEVFPELIKLRNQHQKAKKRLSDGYAPWKDLKRAAKPSTTHCVKLHIEQETDKLCGSTNAGSQKRQVASQVAPDVTSQAAPQVTSQVTSQMTPHIASQLTLNMIPLVAPHVISQVTAHVVSQITPEMTSEMVSQVVSQLAPQVTLKMAEEFRSELHSELTPEVITQVGSAMILQLCLKVARKLETQMEQKCKTSSSSTD